MLSKIVKQVVNSLDIVEAEMAEDLKLVTFMRNPK